MFASVELFRMPLVDSSDLFGKISEKGKLPPHCPVQTVHSLLALATLASFCRRRRRVECRGAAALRCARQTIVRNDSSTRRLKKGDLGRVQRKCGKQLCKSRHTLIEAICSAVSGLGRYIAILARKSERWQSMESKTKVKQSYNTSMEIQ